MRNYSTVGGQFRSKALKLDALTGWQKRFTRNLIVAWLLGFAALVILPWRQTAPASGKVIAYNPNEREQEISATIDGVVKHWYVGEGALVKKGDPIVELADNDPEIIEKLEREKNALFRRLKASEAAAETTKINLERQRKLFSEGLSSKREFEVAQVEYTRYLVDAANAGAELARIDVRISRQLTQKIYAPVNGTILRVIAGQGAGRVVKTGQMLALLVPETTSRSVELWLSGNDVPLVREGASVRLQFEGWPALQFSGWPSVAVGTFGGVVRYIDPSDASSGKFRVLIEPSESETWPEPQYLRQGVRVLGWVQLNQVPLGFEVWRQLNGFPPSVESKNSKQDKDK
jgi:multidrug efflux pump subunit AcrA (membrane-fusion protein)